MKINLSDIAVKFYQEFILDKDIDLPPEILGKYFTASIDSDIEFVNWMQNKFRNILK